MTIVSVVSTEHPYKCDHWYRAEKPKLARILRYLPGCVPNHNSRDAGALLVFSQNSVMYAVLCTGVTCYKIYVVCYCQSTHGFTVQKPRVRKRQVLHSVCHLTFKNINLLSGAIISGTTELVLILYRAVNHLLNSEYVLYVVCISLA